MPAPNYSVLILSYLAGAEAENDALSPGGRRFSIFSIGWYFRLVFRAIFLFVFVFNWKRRFGMRPCGHKTAMVLLAVPSLLLIVQSFHQNSSLPCLSSKSSHELSGRFGPFLTSIRLSQSISGSLILPNLSRKNPASWGKLRIDRGGLAYHSQAEPSKHVGNNLHIMTSVCPNSRHFSFQKRVPLELDSNQCQ